MEDQTAIPVPQGPAPGHPCAWCGHRPAEPYELERTRYATAANGSRVVKRKALEAYACSRHRQQFDAQRSDDAV